MCRHMVLDYCRQLVLYVWYCYPYIRLLDIRYINTDFPHMAYGILWVFPKVIVHISRWHMLADGQTWSDG